ncbi:MAG: DUF4878 domain-containing protein [Bacteroidia bacterium]|nr:DUF4878 domain-containing protein [Bacteroidia bacterium]
MKRYRFIFLFLLFSACNSIDKNSPAPAENDIDAAREFIRSALDGKFAQARNYLLPDSSNIQYMAVAERNYQKADDDTKNGYRSASIRIYSPVVHLNDSATIIVFSNSFKNDPDTLKILKTKGQWLVDLKYLYEHDMDSSHINFNLRDSLK